MNLFNASAPDRTRLDLQSKCDQQKQQQFGFGIAAVNIGCRIRFGIAFLLRFLQRFRVSFPALFHLRQDIIAGAVDDAEHRFRLFHGEAFTQRAYDRNAAAHTGFKA